MFRDLFRLSLVLTVITALFAATVVQAAELKAKKVSAAGGTRSVTYAVTGEGTNLAVKASVSEGDASWLEIDPVPPTLVPLVNGKGKVKVTYKVTAKADAGIREGSILVQVGETAAVEVEKIEQAGAACKMKPALNSTKFEFYGGEKSFDFTLPEGCVLETAADSWITATVVGRTVTVKVGELEDNGKTGKIKFTVSDGTKVTDKKVHTIVQSKRTGAGTVKLGLPTTIDTAEKAGKAAASVVFAAKTVMETGEGIADLASDTVGEGSGSSARSVKLLASAVQKVRPAALLADAAKTSAAEPCADGGSVTYSGSSATYANCKEFGIIKNGVISASGTGEPLSEAGARGTIKTGKSGEPFVMTNYTDNTYTTVSDTNEMLMTLSFANLKISPTGDGGSFIVTINGYVDSQYIANEKSERMLLDAKSFKLSLTGSGVTQQASADGLLRSTVFSDGTLVASTELAMSDFAITVTEDELTGDSSVGISGAFAVKSYPENSCFDGTFNLSTDPAIPFVYKEETGVVGGKVIINGAAVTVAADGEATAVVQDAGLNFQPAGNINNVCVMN